MNQLFTQYAPYVRKLQILAERASKAGADEWLLACESALNGEPSRELRKRIPIDIRRRVGAFFTTRELAARLVDGREVRRRASLTVLDPACGIGDLLLAVARHLPLDRSVQETLRVWGRALRGVDMQPEFVAATKARLLILARQRHHSLDSLHVECDALFPHINSGNGLSELASYDDVTHILLNPPFSAMPAPRDCAWAGGHVNSAAVFLEHVLRHVRVGTNVLAILPEVLRTGSRYEEWRRLIGIAANVRRIRSVGLFDSSADVDVFLAVFEKRWRPPITPNRPWSGLKAISTRSIGDLFEVSVGAVVPYRDPEEGPTRRYIHARIVPAWQRLRRIREHRRFAGPVVKPPFVVIRRTSRPGDAYRATASLVLGKSPVAVENHLVVCKPMDGSLDTCQQLLAGLKAEPVNRFLNAHMCCRHLTVGIVKSIPLDITVANIG